MFAAIAGAMATIVMSLSFVDWFLDKYTKIKIDNSVVDIWNWIDDIKSMPLTSRFKNANVARQAVFIIRLTCLLLSIFIINETSFFSSGYETVVLYIFGIILCFITMFLSEFVFFKVAKISSTHVHYALFGVAICAVIGIVAFSFQGSNDDWVSETISDPRFWDPPTTDEINRRNSFSSIMYSALILSIVSSIITLSTMIAITLMFVVFTPAILYPLEFVIRRVAEYPKGSLLGLAVVCGGVATLAKHLS